MVYVLYKQPLWDHKPVWLRTNQFGWYSQLHISCAMPGWYLHLFYSSDVVLLSRVSLFLYVSLTLTSNLAVLGISLKGLVPEVKGT